MTGGSEFFLEGAEPPIAEVPIAETLLKFRKGNIGSSARRLTGSLC
jgi:hypothetical protein